MQSGSEEDEDDDESDEEIGAQGGGAPQRSRHGGGGGGAGGGDAAAQQRAAAAEGLNSEVQKYLGCAPRHSLSWSEEHERYRDPEVDAEWVPWGKVPSNKEGYLCLRDKWLTWMACTSKLLQTVDNRHLNRHLDYLYSGPTVNFVDLQSTPQIGRRLSALAHLVECVNNLGEFPLDCVVPTPETELLFGQAKGSKLVRGMRMKSEASRASQELNLTSSSRASEKWLKSFRRGAIDGREDEDDMGAEKDDADGKVGDGRGMVETQMLRLVVRIFPVVHAHYKGMGRVISLVGLPGVSARPLPPRWRRGGCSHPAPPPPPP
jgi:hypothetical protein